ncbi:MAG: F0F1 ATP synthase subunit A [Clostridiales bacterium]|nr:F0F1 ATP synthase subunit A [Clostridiales bacterium]
MIVEPITLSIKEELIEQIEIETVFTIPNTNISIDESTVVSWIIMAVITLFAIILTRNLKVEGKISRRQLLLETCVEKMQKFFHGIMGKDGDAYIPWLMSTAIFIGASNMVGLFGFKPPTKSLQVTAAMALTSIVLVQVAGIRKKRVGGYLKSFAKPSAVMLPINVLEIIIKPLSLCMRLFGNVIGAFIIMELIKCISVFKVGVSLAFSFYFDLFDGFLQAYIFVFLTSLYIQEAVE